MKKVIFSLLALSVCLGNGLSAFPNPVPSRTGDLMPAALDFNGGGGGAGGATGATGPAGPTGATGASGATGATGGSIAGGTSVIPFSSGLIPYTPPGVFDQAPVDFTFNSTNRSDSTASVLGFGNSINGVVFIDGFPQLPLIAFKASEAGNITALDVQFTLAEAITGAANNYRITASVWTCAGGTNSFEFRNSVGLGLIFNTDPVGTVVTNTVPLFPFSVNGDDNILLLLSIFANDNLDSAPRHILGYASAGMTFTITPP